MEQKVLTALAGSDREMASTLIESAGRKRNSVFARAKEWFTGAGKRMDGVDLPDGYTSINKLYKQVQKNVNTAIKKGNLPKSARQGLKDLYHKFHERPHAEAKALLLFLEKVVKQDGTIDGTLKSGRNHLYAFVDGWWDLGKATGQGGGSCTKCANMFADFAEAFDFDVDVFFRFGGKRGVLIQESFKAGT